VIDEIVWACAPGPQWGILARQGKAMDFQPTMISAARAALYYDDIVAWGGDLPLGVGIEIWWDPSYEGCPGIGGTTPMSLHERWVEATGEPINMSVGSSYETMQILIDSIERAGTLDADAVLKAIGETDMKTICGYTLFEEETHFSRIPLTFGQWYKTDGPEEWELPIVFSKHDIIPATAEPMFPIPYD